MSNLQPTALTLLQPLGPLLVPGAALLFMHRGVALLYLTLLAETGTMLHLSLLCTTVSQSYAGLFTGFTELLKRALGVFHC